LVGIATIIAVFGITGVPFFNGSISKYFIMSGTNFTVNAAIIFINLGTIISFIKYSTILFGANKPAAGESAVQEQSAVKNNILQQSTVLVLGGFCLAGGILGEQFISFLFNIDVNVDTIGYLQKVGLYLLSAGAGILIYKYFVSVSPFFKRIREIELGFRGACVSMGIFFAAVLIAARVFS
jgi:multicomponent Na+:H+ antiporter subunit D